jgi:hypothetical protein
MTTPTLPTDFAKFGDDLERAAGRQLNARRRRLGRVGAGVAALLVVGAGTAAAAGLFTPKQVATGMPAGTAIFGQTNPTCTLDANGTTYHCTLASAPARDVSDFTGSKELVAVDGRIAGGCIGQDAAGMHWDCYMGQDAVRHEILVQDLLGQPELTPGRG